mgnify:CR=1 FL=1
MMSVQVNEVDRAMGRTLRTFRKAAGLSQAELGRAAGISFQQIQKYETGHNRLSISRLFQLADTMRVDPVELLVDVQRSIRDETAGQESPERERMEFFSSISGRRAIEGLIRLRDPQAVSALADFIHACADGTARRAG